MAKVTTLLKEYEYFFPQSLTDMKGVKGELGEIKIELWPDAKQVKKKPYHIQGLKKRSRGILIRCFLWV